MAGKKKAPLALEVCMYGNREIGFGFLAVAPIEDVLPGKGKRRGTALAMFGTGEPGAYGSLTETLYAAQSELKDALEKGTKGEITVFLPGGERCATVELGSCKAIGDLKWGPAPVYTFEVK